MQGLWNKGGGRVMTILTILKILGIIWLVLITLYFAILIFLEICKAIDNYRKEGKDENQEHITR